MGVFSSWLSTLAQRETTFGISPPMSTPSAKARAPPAPQNVSVSGATKNSPSAVEAVGLDVRVAAVPDRGRAVGIALAGAEHLREQSVERLLTIWIVPTVAIEIGAGRVQFTIVPSGAIRVIGRVTPSFQVTSQASSGKSGANRPPQRRPVGAVDAELDLRARAGEVEDERVALLGRGQLDLRGRAGHVDVLARRHSPSGSSASRRRTSCSDCSISSSETVVDRLEP